MDDKTSTEYRYSTRFVVFLPDKVHGFVKTKEARLILQSGLYNLLTNISEGTAFLLQGLTYNETLRFENKRIACNMIL